MLPPPSLRADLIAASTTGGKADAQSAQRSSREHRAASGWRSPGCSGEEGFAVTMAARRAGEARGGRRRARRPRASTCTASPPTSPRRRRSRRSWRPPRALRPPGRARQQRRRRHRRAVGEIQTKHLDMQLDINLRSIVLFYRECLPMLQAAGAEHNNALVVNTSSISGKRGEGWLSVYSATKHGVVGWTEAMNKELGAAGHQVDRALPRVRRHADDRLRQGAGHGRGDDPPRGHRRVRALPAAALPRLRRARDHVRAARRRRCSGRAAARSLDAGARQASGARSRRSARSHRVGSARLGVTRCAGARRAAARGARRSRVASSSPSTSLARLACSWATRMLTLALGRPPRAPSARA